MPKLIQSHKKETLPALTLDELKKFKEELKYRKEILREEIRIDLKKAADLGDLFHENFPFDAALAKQRVNEARITDLTFLIRNSIVKKNSKVSDKIKINNIVKIQREDGEIKVLKVVTKDHFEISKEADLITSESPVGRALLGKRQGENLQVNLPRGVVNYFVLKIS